MLILALVGIALPPQAWSQNSFSEDIHAKEPARSEKSARPASTPEATAAEAAGKSSPNPRFAQAALTEAQDFKIPPRDQLRGDPLHAETPTRLPGGQTLTTEALHALYEKSPGTFLIFDVLGGQQGLPQAQNALPAGRGGSFNDAVQQEFGNYLHQVTRGRKDLPLVFYCQSVYCWMSYNAALRAVRLGYTQVFWYRGGLEAWQQAGLPTTSR